MSKITKKYEFTGETKIEFGITLKRIRALVSFGIVAKGEIGGWIEKDSNLDQSGDAWVYGDARIYGNARVYGDAWVYGDARIYGNARVYGDARIYGDAQVSGDARVSGDANLSIIYGRGYTLTVHADKKIKVRFNVGCFSGSRKEFAARAKQEGIKPKTVKAVLALVDAAVEQP